jgi:hypothetical protein
MKLVSLLTGKQTKRDEKWHHSSNLEIVLLNPKASLN